MNSASSNEESDRSATVYGYPAGQVTKDGDCVWLRSGVDDVWCLKHRQLAPELRQLAGVPLCVTRLETWKRWSAARRMPKDQLEWATQDPDWCVRRVAVERMPLNQLDWVIEDPHPEVRCIAAMRMPLDQLQWATRDPDDEVRWIAAYRMPADQLRWAAQDPSEQVRYTAALKMPPEQLGWAAQEPNDIIRQTVADLRSGCPSTNCSGR